MKLKKNFFIISLLILISLNHIYCQDNNTEFGVADDLTVFGMSGTYEDPDVEIKGFTVFGATQAVYTANISSGPGNVIINGILGVSSGAYIAGTSTFSYVSSITISGAEAIFIKNGNPGQILRKKLTGELEWVDINVSGDNLGNHIATMTITADYGINVSSLNITGNGVIGTNPIFKVGNSTLVILNDGKIGIGSLSPEYTFDINIKEDWGGMRVQGNKNVQLVFDAATGYTPQYTFSQGGLVRFTNYVAENGDFWAIGRFNNSGSYIDAPLIISRTSGDVEITKNITVDGNIYASNIGIGTTEPDVRLHVYEPQSAAYVTIQGASDGYNFGALSIINSDYSRIWQFAHKSDGSFGFAHYNGSWIHPFYITSNGNVGIGTTDPQARLEINGQVKIVDGTQGVGKVLTSDANGVASWQTFTAPGDNLGNHIATRTLSMGNYPIINVSSISINGSGINLGSTAFEVIGDTFTVRSGGRVGIGGIDSTSRLSILNANYILGWGGGSQISSLLASDQGGAIELGGLNDRANPITNGIPYIDFHFGTGSAEDYNYRIINNANNRLSFISKTATTLVLSTTNVGIGASSPSPWDGGNRRTLHIEDTTNQALIRIKGSQVDMEAGVGGSNNDLGFLWTRTNHGLTFGTNNSERIRITNDGRIGIGTDSPHSSARIDIKGFGNSNTTYALGVRNSNDTYTFWIRDDGAIATSGQRTYFSGFDGSGNHWIGIAGGSEASNLFMSLINTGGDTTADGVQIAPRGNLGIYVDSTGNVGIGTSNSGSYRLYIRGNSYFDGTIDISSLPSLYYGGNYVMYYNNRLYYLYSSACPTFYSFDGEKYKPEGGILHGQAGKFFDRLHTRVLNFMPKSGRIKAKIKIEEPEVSYIDYVAIIVEDRYQNGNIKKYELKPKWASKDLDKLREMDSYYSINTYGDDIEIDFGEINEPGQSLERIVQVISKGYYDPFYKELQKEEWREIRKGIAKELTDLDSDGNLNIFRPVIIRNIDEFGYNSPQNLFAVNGPVWFKGSDKTLGLRVNDGGKVGINLLDPDYELKVDGDIWINFNQWTLSDERLIKDIEPIGNVVDKIKKIQGVRYRFKDDLEKDSQTPKSTQIGIIAQNLEKVFPELVVSDSKGFKALSYEKLVPILIEAIKEQQIEIDKLKRELELVKGLNY